MRPRKQFSSEEEESQYKRDRNAASARKYNAKGRVAKHFLECMIKFHPKALDAMWNLLQDDLKAELDECYPVISWKHEVYLAEGLMNQFDPDPILVAPPITPGSHHPFHAGTIGNADPFTHGADVMSELRTVLAKRGVKT